MNINNATINAAAGDERLRLQAAANSARNIQNICRSVGAAYERASKQHVSLLALATGSWQSEIGINFAGLDRCEMEARKLIDEIGPDGTVEISLDDVPAIGLLEGVKSLQQLVAPLRAAAELARSKK